MILLNSIKTFSEEDLSKLADDYGNRSENLAPELQGLSWNYFIQLSKMSIFERIKDFEKILGAGTGGFVFIAKYRAPHSEEWNRMAIKILPDEDDFFHFNDNLILAKLTGKMEKNYYNESETMLYSYDENEGRAERHADQDQTDDHNQDFINKFLEMQKGTLKYFSDFAKMDKVFYVTVLVTEAGIGDMVQKLFKSGTDLTANTSNFIRIVTEMVKGCVNVNNKGILHGDIKSDNYVVVVDKNGELHPNIIDFDLILDSSVEPFVNRQLRYTKGFRAPWITPIEKIETRKDSKGQIFIVTKEYYKFDPQFREDTYALAKTILEILKINASVLYPYDPKLMKIKNYVNNNIVFKANSGPSFIPTTSQMYSDLVDIMVNEIDPKEQIQLTTPINNQYILKKVPSHVSKIKRGNSKLPQNVLFNNGVKKMIPTNIKKRLV